MIQGPKINGLAGMVNYALTRSGTLAAITAASAIAAVAILALGAGQSGAVAATDTRAAFGEARQASLTLDVPSPIDRRIHTPPGAEGRPIILIDAGHGGHDPGATSVSTEIVEKDLALQLAGELRDVLVERGRVRVVMSREDDRFLSLDERAALARNAGAALFLSIHADSAPNPLARGASVYSLSDVASDAEAARIAAAQNGGAVGHQAGDASVTSLLADLATRSEMNASADFAARLVRRSSGRFEFREQPHRFAAFHVLRRAEVPAVLFEAGYISNADDELLLRSAEHRRTIATALAQAIETDVAARMRR